MNTMQIQLQLQLYKLILIRNKHTILPVTVAEGSKACTVFARSEAGILGSNSTQGMDVGYVCACAVFCGCVQAEA
jgi:hypothetical protein